MDFLSNVMNTSNVNEQLILHIPLPYDIVQKINNELNIPIQPVPQSYNDNSRFKAIENDEIEPEDSNTKYEGSSLCGEHFKVQNSQPHQQRVLDLSTTFHCMWDTHKFEGKPIGIPTKFIIETEEYKTIGCFCSIQCAAAHNMADVRVSIDTRYERHGLIETMIGSEVFLAPDRECLVRFGGNTTVEQFRKSNAIIERVLYPPMIPQHVYHVFQPIRNKCYNKPETSNTTDESLSWIEMLRPRQKKQKKGLSQFLKGEV